MNYTKGDWKVMDKGVLFYDIGNGEDRTALVPIITANAEANANLIAAAPDMYEALKALRHLLLSPEFSSNIEEANKLITNSLAKAESK